MIIYIISDAVGETAQRIVQATLLQYPQLKPVIRTYSFVTTEAELTPIMQDAAAEQAVVAITFVAPELAAAAQKFTTAHDLPLIDYMSPLMQVLTAQTNMAPLAQPGMLHTINTDYFKKVAALDFAVAHDDGQGLQTLAKADLVILGVSRTSKTPVSLYLAEQRLKVANIPLLPNNPLDPAVYQLPKEKLVGLIISPQRLQKVRQTRMTALGLSADNYYTDVAAIEKELAYATEIFAQLQITPIDTTERSVEETAALIMDR
ncbi:pyruvate, water dikinase regulatory protein [Loigolactobacillus zhaoyuanensis]|uniref:Putative pyruvate, phosphate dikinase regulatory protein n=1 Tax=Loigolactobacillus zhaoyuanensis TaxID=2486017 RepID=A0ABW8UA38_9LACO|nr:pyruvate, water dikinase regulatory protein [Loigolactobacillus zhaoyuanensis]